MKKQRWEVGDLFAVEQLDGMRTVGQVLDIMMKNVASCAFYDQRISPEIAAVDIVGANVIALLAVTREQLDYWKWKVIGHESITISRSLWPNEEFRDSGWVGAKIYDAGLAESFLDSYYGLQPWDDWKDPHYLDGLLASPDKAPTKAVFKRR